MRLAITGAMALASLSFLVAACMGAPESKDGTDDSSQKASDGNLASGGDQLRDGLVSQDPTVEPEANGGGWKCPWSSYHGMQYLTCSGGAECPLGTYQAGRQCPHGSLYHCAGNVPQPPTTCPNGCTQGPVPSNDACH